MKAIYATVVLVLMTSSLNAAVEKRMWLKAESNGTDSSAYANNATLTGATYQSGTLGEKAFRFNGFSQYVSCGTSSTIKLTDQLTISVWVYPERRGFNEALVSTCNSSTQKGWQLGFLAAVDGSSKISFDVYKSDGTKVQAVWGHFYDNYPLKSWRHIVVVYDKIGANKMELYVDGVRVSSVENPPVITYGSDEVRLGIRSGQTSLDDFKGRLDQVTIYSGAMSQSEVTDLYLSERPISQVHMLHDGPFDVNVDASAVRSSCNKMISGMSFVYLTWGLSGNFVPFDHDGIFTLPNSARLAIKSLHLPLTRVYGMGRTSYFSMPINYSLNTAISKFKALNDQIGVPEENSIMEFEGPDPTSAEKISEVQWVFGAEYALTNTPLHRLEIGNEPYTGSYSTNEYRDKFNAVSVAIHAKASSLGKTIEIGLPISRIDWNKAWREDLMSVTAGNFDYVVPHHYCHLYETDGSSIEDNILGKNYWALDRALDINQILNDVPANQNAYQYDSEWAPIYHDSSGNVGDFAVRTGNIYGTLHSAVRLIYYAKGEFVEAASAWTSIGKTPTSMGYGLLPLYDFESDKRTYKFWLYYYFNRHLGDDILELTGTVPYYTPQLGSLSEFSGPEVPMLITKTSTNIYIVAVNGSWANDHTATLNLSDFVVGNTAGVRMTNDDIDAHPLIDAKGDVVEYFSVSVSNNVITFPVEKHSVAFVTLTAAVATNNTPISWLQDYGYTNNYDTAALDDPDGDGLENWEEYHTDTNPTNSESFLQVAISATSITFDTSAVVSYDVEGNDNLVSNVWTTLTNISGTGSSLNYSETNNFSQRYYRLKAKRK